MKLKKETSGELIYNSCIYKWGLGGPRSKRHIIKIKQNGGFSFIVSQDILFSFFFWARPGYIFLLFSETGYFFTLFRVWLFLSCKTRDGIFFENNPAPSSPEYQMVGPLPPIYISTIYNIMIKLTLCLPVLSADNLCKQFGPRSGPIRALTIS